MKYSSPGLVLSRMSPHFNSLSHVVPLIFCLSIVQLRISACLKFVIFVCLSLCLCVSPPYVYICVSLCVWMVTVMSLCEWCLFLAKQFTLYLLNNKESITWIGNCFQFIYLLLSGNDTYVLLWAMVMEGYMS